MVTLRNPLVDNATEGYEEDLDPHTVGIAAAGFFPQNPSSDNMNAGMQRDVDGNLLFTDEVAGGPYTLTQLLGGTPTLFDPNKMLLETSGCLVYIGDGDIMMKT